MKNHFEWAQIDNALELHRLVNAAYRGDSARGGWTHEADLVSGERISLEEVKEIILSSDQFFLTYFMGETIAACAYVKIEEKGLYTGMFTVDPGLQNSGIGSLLFVELNRIAKEKSFSYIRLEVIHVRDSLIAYYQRKGFVLTGHSEPFPLPDLAKVKNLRLLEMVKELS